MHPAVTAERLRSLWGYDPETGLFTRIRTTKGSGKVGAVASCVTGGGYVTLRIDYRQYLAHRLAYLYMTGEFPLLDIDHINGVRNDNRWINLRAVPKQWNSQNMRRATAKSISGVLGAHKTRSGRYRSLIQIRKRAVLLGTFDTAEEAHQAYLKAKRRLHEGCTI